MTRGPAPSPMVFGPHKAVVKAALWSRIMWLALRAYRSPRRALDAVRRMVAHRAKAQRWTTAKYARVSGRYFWNFYSPGWPSASFDRFVERELDRVAPFRGRPPALQTVVFAITKRCSFQCEHCCEWAVLNRRETLSTDALRAVVERVRARGVAQLFLSGGEPLRRFDDLLAVVQAASRETDVWILTSGHRLTAERAERLRGAGLTGVALSLDHWAPEQHDRFRGVPGAFASVERAADSARAAGLVVALSLCPTREFVSAENLDAYARVARRLGASFVQILEPKPVGHYEGRDVALGPREQQLLESFFERMNTDPAFHEFPAVSYADHSKRRIGCLGAGDRYVYIDTDGLLHPCPFCREPAGHVLEGDLDASLARLGATGCPARDQEAHVHG